MSGTSSSSPLPHNRPRRVLVWVGVVAVLAIAALAAAALIPGSHSSGSDGLARRSVAAHTSQANTLHRTETSVLGSKIPAKDYGTKVSEMENGVSSQGAISDLSPLPVRSFNRPIAEYRAYAERWAATLGRDVRPLTSALRAGRRGPARRAWQRAFSDYLHLGAVYGLLPGDLDDELAGLPGRIGDPRFVGLHRIEMGLWTHEPVRSLAPLGTRLSRAAARLRAELPTLAIDPKRTGVRLRRGLIAVKIAPLDYVTRAHEILEDAQRDLMSGTEVPWSHAGVLGTAAGVAVTRKVIATLAPLMAGRENTLGTSQYWLARLSAVLHTVRRPDGTYPTLNQLSPRQRQLIDGTLTGALGALQQVPETLETSGPTRFPKLAASDAK